VAKVTFHCRNEVPGVLAVRGCAVVTGRARAENLCVVNVQYRLPNIRRVAVFTNVCRKNVLRVLARRNSAVVTADAVTGYVRMIEICGQPGDGGVAVVAIIAARDMRRMLSCCGDAIMTGAAATQNLRVVDSHRRYPHRHAVAVLTDIGRQYMGWILTGRGDAIVAVATVSGDAGVIKIGR